MKSETNFKISQILFLNGFSHTEISYLHINTFSLSCLNQGKKYGKMTRPMKLTGVQRVSTCRCLKTWREMWGIKQNQDRDVHLGFKKNPRKVKQSQTQQKWVWFPTHRVAPASHWRLIKKPALTTGLALLTPSIGKLKCKHSFIFQTENFSHVPATAPWKCEIFASEALDPNKEFKSCCLCWKYFVIVTREHFNNWLGCWLASGLREKNLKLTAGVIPYPMTTASQKPDSVPRCVCILSVHLVK